MDNLKAIETRVDTDINPAGAPGSILAQNHNEILKDVLSKVGKYSGSPYSANKVLTVFPSGSMSWNSNALNDTNEFTITVSKLTSDLNDFGELLSRLSVDDLLKFKDFTGRSVDLLFQSFVSDVDVSANDIYIITVKGVAQNINYTYQDTEVEPCVFSAKSTGTTYLSFENFKIKDTDLINQNTEVQLIDSEYIDRNIDMSNYTILVDTLPDNNNYFNGYFKIDDVLFPTKDKLDYRTYKITNNDKFTSFPQGKVFETNNVIYVIVNEGSAHVSSDLETIIYYSTDFGTTFKRFKTFYTPVVNPALGTSSWGAGTDNVKIYGVIRLRGVDYTTANSSHVFIYGDLVDGFIPEPSTMIKKTINLSKAGRVPILYSSFAKLGNGDIAFGYEYEDGEVGLAITSDLGDSWTEHIIYTSAEMSGSPLMVEPELLWDSEENILVGTLRTQNPFIKHAEFFKSSDLGVTFIKTPFDTKLAGSPMPLVKHNDKYYSFTINRHTNLSAEHLEANVADAISTGGSAFNVFDLGDFYYGSVISSGLGIPAGLVYKDKLHWFYSVQNENDDDFSDVYMSVTDLSRNSFTDIYKRKIIPFIGESFPESYSKEESDLKYQTIPNSDLKYQTDEYSERVRQDGGRTEAKSLIDFTDKLSNLEGTETLALFPGGFKSGVLYGVELPNINNSILGDFTVVSPANETRVNQYGVVETMGANEPLIDFTDGFPVLLIKDTNTTVVGSGDNTTINSSEGVLFVESSALVNDLVLKMISLSDGTISNRVVLRYDNVSNRIRSQIISGGVIQADINFVVTNITSYHKIAILYKLNRFELWIDGVLRSSDNTGISPVGLDELSYDQGDGGNPFFGKVKQHKVFDNADIDCAILTT